MSTLCPPLQNSNSLPNCYLRKPHFITLQLYEPHFIQLWQQREPTWYLTLGRQVYTISFPHPSSGGNWGTGANLSVWDYKTFGTGPNCRMMESFCRTSLKFSSPIWGPLRGFLSPNTILASYVRKCLGVFCVVAVAVVVLWCDLSSQGKLLSQPCLFSMSHA